MHHLKSNEIKGRTESVDSESSFRTTDVDGKTRALSDASTATSAPLDFKGADMIPYVQLKSEIIMNQRPKKPIPLAMCCSRSEFEHTVGPMCPYVGHCRPCVFHRRGKCKKGESCSYCHFQHGQFSDQDLPRKTGESGKPLPPQEREDSSTTSSPVLPRKERCLSLQILKREESASSLELLKNARSPSVGSAQSPRLRVPPGFGITPRRGPSRETIITSRIRKTRQPPLYE